VRVSKVDANLLNGIRELSLMALTSDAHVSIPAFELQEDVLTIHCDIQLVKTSLIVIN